MLSYATCTRRLQFCAGHRVMGHENKCAHLHGHNYVVEITAQAELDDIGRVIDFSVLKERVGKWIDDAWDHGFILHIHDEEAAGIIGAFQPSKEQPVQKVFALPYNPTAENMARYLGENVCPACLLGTGATVTRVVVHETENCKAEWIAANEEG